MGENIDHNTNGSEKFARIENLENIIDSYGTSYAYEFDVTLPNGNILEYTILGVSRSR